MDGHALVTSPLDVTFFIVNTLVTFLHPSRNRLGTVAKAAERERARGRLAYDVTLTR